MMIFDVDSGGALSMPDYDPPSTRGDAYDLAPTNLSTAAALVAEAKNLWPLMSLLLWCYDDERQRMLDEAQRLRDVDQQAEARAIEDRLMSAMPEESEEHCLAWVEGLSGEALAELLKEVEEWCAGQPDLESEEDYIHVPMSGRAAAMQYFEAKGEIVDLLDIAIVEGDHPGSTYYAAELTIPVDEANERAERHGLDVRFREVDY